MGTVQMYPERSHPRRARVKTGGRLYAGIVTLDGPWVHLVDGRLLSPHMDGYVSVSVGDVSFLARDIKAVRWLDDEQLEAAG